MKLILGEVDLAIDLGMIQITMMENILLYKQEILQPQENT